jgi:hypothetical protein
MDDVDRSFSDDISRRPKVRVHVAGVLHGAVQKCARCGLPLIDHRGEKMILLATPRHMTGFAVGSHVAVDRSGRWVTGPKLEPNEVPCDLFERN